MGAARALAIGMQQAAYRDVYARWLDTPNLAGTHFPFQEPAASWRYPNLRHLSLTFVFRETDPPEYLRLAWP